jgi:hypothetical protein
LKQQVILTEESKASLYTAYVSYHQPVLKKKHGKLAWLAGRGKE